VTTVLPSPTAPDDTPNCIADALALAPGLRCVSDTPQLDLQLLLASTLDRPRSYLLAHPDRAFTLREQATFTELLTRRQRGEPVAYLIGVQEFWSLPISVSPAVLIPRPETELLVELTLAQFDERPRKVAEIGTGSGAIAVALASERPGWEILATDLSPAALGVARTNQANLLGKYSQIRFATASCGASLAADQFDLVVSNPPYVASDDPHLKSLTFEPALALVAGSDGLDVIRKLVPDARRALRPGGWVLLEHGHDQAGAVADRLRSAGFREIANHRDLAGTPRVTRAQWSPGTKRGV